MGMSASQARFLCLTARKNNVEFEGQQINQQRTCLSNESASYYSELCNMAVPVPPSIDDYTKVNYSFNDGAMTNSITTILYSSSDDKYHINYLQQWQDDYAIVPASSALVMDDGGNYTIGNDTLRKMDATIPTSEPSSYPSNEYFDSLETDAQRFEALKTEAYYVALLREKFGNDSEDFYVRYIKNENTGGYDPYFYSANDLKDATYSDRHLASVPAYTLGSTTKTKEVINQSCQVVVDASGRYVAITFEDTTSTKKVNEDNKAEIDKYYAEHPEPKQDDYTKEVKELEEYEVESANSELATKFINAAASCYSNATVIKKPDCYMHVLAYLLNLHTDGNGNPDGAYYPQTFSVSDPLYGPSCTITITTGTMTSSAIDSYPDKVEDLVDVSNVVTNGKDGVMLTVADIDKYADLGLSAEMTDRLGEMWAGGDLINKLMSNYCIDSSNNKVKKTIFQKAVDLYYLCENRTSLGVDYETQIMPLIKTFQYDMTHIEKEIKTKEVIKIVPDEDKYNKAHKEWQDGIPKYETHEVEKTVTEPGKTYNLIANTVTDEDAYNNAMNDYVYQQQVYDHKVQEINSKLEILQIQDKQLELKLKQLDTEENAISTEMDAVKKVISKNVDNSFKTFSA